MFSEELATIRRLGVRHVSSSLSPSLLCCSSPRRPRANTSRRLAAPSRSQLRHGPLDGADDVERAVDCHQHRIAYRSCAQVSSGKLQRGDNSS
jgi:hypothetical protein